VTRNVIGHYLLQFCIILYSSELGNDFEELAESLQCKVPKMQ